MTYYYKYQHNRQLFKFISISSNECHNMHGKDKKELMPSIII